MSLEFLRSVHSSHRRAWFAPRTCHPTASQRRLQYTAAVNILAVTDFLLFFRSDKEVILFSLSLINLFLPICTWDTDIVAFPAPALAELIVQPIVSNTQASAWRLHIDKKWLDQKPITIIRSLSKKRECLLLETWFNFFNIFFGSVLFQAACDFHTCTWVSGLWLYPFTPWLLQSGSSFVLPLNLRRALFPLHSPCSGLLLRSHWEMRVSS